MASSTDRTIGPTDALTIAPVFPLGVGIKAPSVLTLLLVYFIPTSPHQLAGALMLDPISDPIPPGEHLLATKVPSPPELPPGVRVGSQGFLALPNKLFRDSQVSKNIGMLVLTIGTAPASKSCLTMRPSSLALCSGPARVMYPRLE